MSKKRVISGIQTSGDVHLGNYIGAIKRWADMQSNHDSMFFLADLHAITVDQDPQELKRATIEVAASLFASGLAPGKSTIFIQSHVKAHTEFAWLLNCVSPMGWLSRMTQFKDKAGKDKESASVGLFTYPVLQAADVLLYDIDFVPVGEDQKQHVELIRDIAGAINRKFGKDLLKLPEPMIPENIARIKSLRDGLKKMSKSDPSDQSRINLKDDKETIYQKLKRAKTDSIAEITYEPDTRPEVANLLSIFSEFSGKNISALVAEYNGLGFAKFKEDLAELVAESMSPITTKYQELIKDPEEIMRYLKPGAEKASAIAEKKLAELKKEFGFWS